VAEASEEKLISLMFGDTITETTVRRPDPGPKAVQPLLELRQASLQNGLSGIDLAVFPGEIVGVAGVSGNGQREMGDLILGLEKCFFGAKYLFGQDATHWSVDQTRSSGVAFIPEDPLRMITFGGLSVLENMALSDRREYALHGGFSINWKSAQDDLERSLKHLGFILPPMNTPMGALSGGNIQRVILARETARNPKLILAFYPTRGLDVQSANSARNLLMARRDKGAGVLLISEDLSELFSLSDRLVVLYRGRIVAGGRPQEITLDEVGYLMTGSKKEQRADE
jgi:simple sugar transport system ATP-binding protein